MLNGQTLSIDDVADIAWHAVPASITQETLATVARSRVLFEDIASQNIPIYGVTTGYGEMVYISVDVEQESNLQTNLIRSHCAEIGRAHV